MVPAGPYKDNVENREKQINSTINQNFLSFISNIV